MITAVEQVVRYCKRYEVLCAGANERGYCNTTTCWNSHRLEQSIYAAPTIAQTPFEKAYDYAQGFADGYKWRSEEAARKFGQAYTYEKNILYCPKPEDFCSCAARKIDTQPKTGEWILTPMLPDIHRYKCSNCNCHHGARYDYCPSCGAKMRVKE